MNLIKGYVYREIDIYGNIIDTSELTIDDVIKEYEKRHPVIEGVRHSISEWCKIYNIKQATVNARIRNGMSSIDAITTPIRRWFYANLVYFRFASVTVPW